MSSFFISKFTHNFIFLFILFSCLTLISFNVTSKLDMKINSENKVFIASDEKQICSRPKPNSLMWKYVKHNRVYYHLFDAYWDTRHESDKLVKILTFIRRHKRRYNPDIKFFCVFWYGQRNFTVQGKELAPVTVLLIQSFSHSC